MLDWLRLLLGPPRADATETLAAEVDHLRGLLEQEREEKTRLVAQEREERDRADRGHRRERAELLARVDRLVGDLVALADARARAELERYRWSTAQLEREKAAPLPAPGPELEGAGPEAIDKAAGLNGPTGDAQPPWQHSLVAEGHMEPPQDDAEAEQAALARERLRVEGR